jgi:hypothetical protein
LSLQTATQFTAGITCPSFQTTPRTSHRIVASFPVRFPVPT